MDPALDDTGSVRRAYRQLFELGRGGMARVYLAESLASGLRKPVVLKVLNPLLSADTEVRAAFRREAELSAQMNHPNVVQVMEVVETPESAVIVMEHLEGKALSALLKEAGKHLSLALHMHILTQVLAGLHHFHELRDLEGTPLHPVHRDVSPQNVMVLHDGPVKVLDFGIAKINAPSAQGTRTGIIKG
ncbi:MAG: serine/threonine-protein kinase, partial [Polyangiaceae bacterium]